jgi:phenylacetate-CoA ligase
MSDLEPQGALDLPDYSPGAVVALGDEERWPQLGPEGRARLDRVLGHPDAPLWRHRAGHRLTPEQIERARHPLPLDGWLEQHLDIARRLPAYRDWPGPLDRLEDFPLISREDLFTDVTAFVPRDADLDRLVQGSSSGTTGHALRIPDDIEDVARTFWLTHRLVESLGIRWAPDPARLALALVVHQHQAFTYASVVPGFGDAAMARLNLNHREWPSGGRDRFLSETDPQLISGNPTSLEALLVPVLVGSLHPLAIVSGASQLSGPLRRRLEDAFGCPVIDVFGLHETRPIAASTDGGPFRVLDLPVLVEVMDAAGAPVPPGSRGELVVTAASNPLLPLVRYRTGDFGRLVEVDGRPAIADLEGRADVAFTSTDGRSVPGVDLTQQLQDAGGHGWTVVQHSDGRLDAVIVGADTDDVARRLRAMLGQPVEVRRAATLADLGPGKPRRYHRED